MAEYAGGSHESRWVDLETVRADLRRLNQLSHIGATVWRGRYDGDLARLTTASNTAFAALGLQPKQSQSGGS
jgi:hypothetical protein